MKLYQSLAFCIALVCFSSVVKAQNKKAKEDNEQQEHTISLENFRLEGYGSVNYFNYSWDTDPARRNAMDVEKFVLEPSYIYNDNFRLKAEIEFEHAGTGVTKELDKFEEFGEYETEVEQGGEVKLEQLNISYTPLKSFNLSIGKLKVPFGIVPEHDEPVDYFTTRESPGMSAIIPTNWYATGLQAFGTLGDDDQWSYAVSFINGLNSTQFSSANWVMRGRQGRFEMINAENMALALRLDYHLGDESYAGISAYGGNSSGNRPKPDLNKDAYVSIVDGHINIVQGPVTFRAVGLYGHLQNSYYVTQANKNISNNLNVKRTPVASAAISYYGQLAYNAGTLLGIEDRLDIFGRYAFYDSMYRVAKGAVNDDPRWERTAYTAGINYKPIDEIVFKTQYTHRVLGIPSANIENTFSLGMGFEF